jgi:hypothetical protein
VNSQKLVCRMPHSPDRWPPHGLPETSRLLKVDHCMLHVRMKMRSGGCVAFSQNDDADTGEGKQEFRGAAYYQKSGCPDTDVSTSRFKSSSRLLRPAGPAKITPPL